MDFEPFLVDLADVLEVDRDDLTDGYVLDNTNWDSINIVSTVVLIDEHLNTTIPGNKLEGVTSVGELLELLLASTR